MRKNQAWFWSKKWQEREREADEAIANGELSEPFESVDELIQHLRILTYEDQPQPRPRST